MSAQRVDGLVAALVPDDDEDLLLPQEREPRLLHHLRRPPSHRVPLMLSTSHNRTLYKGVFVRKGSRGVRGSVSTYRLAGVGIVVDP